MCIRDREKLKNSGELASLDAKLATGLTKVLVGELSRQINIEMEKMALKHELMKGR